MSYRKTMFPPDSVNFGVTPTSWWNDDFPDITIGIPYEQALSEMALAGYVGSSNSGHYPDTDTLKAALALRGLRISEPWTSTYFTINEMHDKTIGNFMESLDFIKTMGGTDMVVAEFGRSSHLQPIDLVPNRPIFSDPEWDALTEGLSQIGEIAKKEGMRLCYHHHMGTGVMVQDDIDRLMASTDEDLVFLLLDTGHLYFAGGDPLYCAEKYAHRIKHVHMKNIRQPVMEKSLAEGLSFHDSIVDGVFTVPGDPAGCIDMEPILQVLADADYEGWLVVEAEQDPAKANPLEYVKMARRYLHEITGL